MILDLTVRPGDAKWRQECQHTIFCCLGIRALGRTHQQFSMDLERNGNFRRWHGMKLAHRGNRPSTQAEDDDIGVEKKVQMNHSVAIKRLQR